MTTVLCTLYNSLYLDKGLVLFDSLCKCAKDFKLYVLCMDEKCYEVLKDLNQEHHIPIRLSDFEEGDVELIEAKLNRPMSEYCWTCSSSFIKYVLKNYNESICTYIDADMYFYNDPQVLIDEMLEAGKSVMMVPHRFTENNLELAKKVGHYCVEFNCFMNNAAGLEVLEYWRNKCLECCSNLGDGIHWGDQKYMDEWPLLFPSSVHVCQNYGAGIAQWNICSYHDYNPQEQKVHYESNFNPVPVYFYHFATLTYRTKRLIDTSIICHKGLDYRTIDLFYKPYLQLIDEKKRLVFEKYGIEMFIKKHPSSKTRISLWHRITSSPLSTYIRTILPFKKDGHSLIVRI